jgi:imidazolonepropionase-like amidohydrolase
MKTLTSLALAAVVSCLLVPSISSAEVPGAPQSHPIALVGGTVHPVSGPDIPGGTVLFDHGRITAVGSTVELPAGTEKIDVHGKDVYPGLIDSRSTIGLVEVDAVRATNDVAETGDINPNIHAEVAVNPESELIPVTRANGITTAAVFPDGGLLPGTCAAMNLDGWTWDAMTLRAPAGLVVNWPTMTVQKGWWERRSEEDQMKARDKSLRTIRDAFRDARAYLRAKQAEAGKDIPFHKTDLRWEAMIPVLEGKVPVFVNADELSQIESAVAWAGEEHLRIVIMGGYDSPRAVPLLKAAGVSVIVGPVYRTPLRSWEPYDWQFTIARKLQEGGVKFAIAGDGSASNERNLPFHAAVSAAYGLPRGEALRAITLSAAEVLGIADRVGSIETGKDANLIVTNGDPLDEPTATELEFIQGKKVELTSKHTRLFDKYHEKYRQMGLPGFQNGK